MSSPLKKFQSDLDAVILLSLLTQTISIKLWVARAILDVCKLEEGVKVVPLWMLMDICTFLRTPMRKTSIIQN